MLFYYKVLTESPQRLRNQSPQRSRTQSPYSSRNLSPLRSRNLSPQQRSRYLSPQRSRNLSPQRSRNQSPYRQWSLSPHRPRNVSPKQSPTCYSCPLMETSRSEMPSPKRSPTCLSMHIEGLGAVQDKDLKLIATLAKKRELEEEREWLTLQFHKLWDEERQQKKLIEAEQTECYHHFLNTKRKEEQKEQEERRVRILIDLAMRRRDLVNYILHKDKRSAHVLEQQCGKKMSGIIDRSLAEEVRCQLAAEKRLEQDRMEHLRKLSELEVVRQKVDNALRRKSVILRDNARLTSINNILSEWESKQIREETKAIETAKREEYVARIAVNDKRTYRIALDREAKLQRAKRMAAFTAQIRDAIRCSR